MIGSFHPTYRLKQFILARVDDFRVLNFLDDLYHMLCLPFGYLAFQVYKLVGKPYFGIWLSSFQGNPFRHAYMARCVDFLVEGLKKTGVPVETTEIQILEVGAYAGASAIIWGKALEKNQAANGLVTSVDPWADYLDLKKNTRMIHRIMNRALSSGRIFDLYQRNIKVAGISHLVRPVVGKSADILPTLKKNAFDLIYIDGDHQVDMVLKDIENALPLLKEGGILCGDDLEMQLMDLDAEFVKCNTLTDMVADPISGIAFHPGVTLAVGEFFQKRISCYDGFWAVKKNDGKFQDVELD